MKKIISKTTILGVIVLLLISFSCNEDFLERHPLDQISSEAFWSNENDVRMAVAGCYARIKGTFFDYQRGYLEGLTDNAFVNWGLYGIDNMAMGNINASSGGVKDHIYNSIYSGISMCNFVMDNIDNTTGVDVNIINNAKGEASFLRALFYFDLANCFGDIPLYNETPEGAEEAKVEKSPKSEVLEFIHQDLDFAISNLPEKLYSDGHAVKGSAMALKTRVLLTEEKWTEAASLAQQIINSGVFSLYEDYASMFLNEGQSNNPEIMFACEYLSPDSYHSVYGMNIEYAKHIFLRKDFVEAFECIDGLPITESPLFDPDDPFTNRDPRHTFIVRNPIGTDWEGHYAYSNMNPTGHQNRKYINPEIPGDYTNAYLQDWNFILLRYADVLLMYAEAKNEAEGPDQTVYDAINEVRARPSVNMPPVDQGKYNTKELVREFIRKERRIEFAMEGIRYFDLKRWHTAHVVMPAIKNLVGDPYIFEEKHYYWPFSQTELDRNPNLRQTAGY